MNSTFRKGDILSVQELEDITEVKENEALDNPVLHQV